MGILEEIREYFASTQNGAREIKTLPKEYSAMVIRDNEGYGVAIEFDDIRDISEKFANSRLFSRTLAIGGIEKKYLILSCMLDSLRYEFATVCAQFVEPGIDGMDRKNLMSEPLEWWKKWRELMGNTISNKEAYSVIAEMMVLDDLYTQDNTVEWTAVNSGSHDIEGNESSYEVKSTVKRYGATITISGQHQLQSLKRLQLYFCRLEQSRTGISINDMKDRLVADGYDKDKIEQQLYQLGYERGASIREEKYKVLEKRKYEVDDTFPKITKASFKDDHIPESITQITYGANFSDIKLIKENYTNLKNKLGRIPKLKDFDDYGEMDVLRIFDNNSLGSYYKFLEKYEKDYTERLSPEEEKVIEFVSKKLANGKRIQELKLLDRMLGYAHEFSLFSGLQKELHKNYGLQISQEQKDNIVNIMTNQFPAGASKKTYSDCIFLEKDDQKGTDYHVSKSFEVMLANKEFYGILKELIDFGISRYERDFSHTYRETDFVLYQKYTYEDVCRLLNWETNEVPLNIGGYKFDKKTKTFPVFINYDKSEDISDTTKYEDHFISSNRLIAISKSGRSIQSEDVQNFLHAEERGIQVHLFVRKNKDDKISKEFYYLGYMHASGNVKEFVMSNTSKTAVEIEWLLDVPVREDLYEYIINE